MSTTYVPYSHDELVVAYKKWVDAAELVEDISGLGMSNYLPRLNAWESYCDVRDGLPHGATHSRRIATSPLKLVSSRATIGAFEVTP